MERHLPSSTSNILLGEQRVAYTLRVNRRSRRVRLMVDKRGLVITIPSVRFADIALGFVQKKSSWVLDKVKFFKSIPAYALEGNRKEFLQYKAQALSLVKERLEYFNKIYGFRYTKVTIRNQKTRWGSCSRHGALSFNYKLALLPPELADYVIVHELCHLGEFNHSQRFWDLVARTVPEYKVLRKQLKGSVS